MQILHVYVCFENCSFSVFKFFCLVWCLGSSIFLSISVFFGIVLITAQLTFLAISTYTISTLLNSCTYHNLERLQFYSLFYSFFFCSQFAQFTFAYSFILFGTILRVSTRTISTILDSPIFHCI